MDTKLFKQIESEIARHKSAIEKYQDQIAPLKDRLHDHSIKKRQLEISLGKLYVEQDGLDIFEPTLWRKLCADAHAGSFCVDTLRTYFEARKDTHLTSGGYQYQETDIYIGIFESNPGYAQWPSLSFGSYDKLEINDIDLDGLNNVITSYAEAIRSLLQDDTYIVNITLKEPTCGENGSWALQILPDNTYAVRERVWRTDYYALRSEDLTETMQWICENVMK